MLVYKCVFETLIQELLKNYYNIHNHILGYANVSYIYKFNYVPVIHISQIHIHAAATLFRFPYCQKIIIKQVKFYSKETDTTCQICIFAINKNCNL